jgi:hypothetical protein
MFSPSMAIKNYASDNPLERSFSEWQPTLRAHGAKHISCEYGDDGKVHGVAFTIKVTDWFIPIKLPARIEKAQAVLKRQWDEGVISHKRGKEHTYGYEQAYRVAWRNILDWVQAQMGSLRLERKRDGAALVRFLRYALSAFSSSGWSGCIPVREFLRRCMVTRYSLRLRSSRRSRPTSEAWRVLRSWSKPIRPIPPSPSSAGPVIRRSSCRPGRRDQHWGRS